MQRECILNYFCKLSVAYDLLPITHLTLNQLSMLNDEWLVAHGSQLMAHGQENQNLTQRLWAWETSAQFGFLGHEPGLSHEP